MIEKIARDVYQAFVQVRPHEDGGFVATAHGRSFHDNLFALGATEAEAKSSLAETIIAALNGPLGATRGFSAGRFKRVMLLDVSLYPTEGPTEQ
ncbi:hypothetical protein [Actinoplanes sp. G11-F43]|uniref:hypothetical protein n=1 Tax=Actinoplanes sp. G11-F43 TaxID=3424130 RepID=UPI003D3430A0